MMSSSDSARHGAVRESLSGFVPLLILAGTVLFLFWFDQAGRAARRPPRAAPAGAPVLRHVAREGRVYSILRSYGTHGMTLVHVSADPAMETFFPQAAASRSFPVAAEDSRPAYSAGVTERNWPFIAGRTGLVRRVRSVLPAAVFAELRPEFRRRPGFSMRGPGRFSGFLYDVPWEIASREGMSRIDEPVIVTVNAAFFEKEGDPEAFARTLRSLLPDVRLLVLVDGLDEAGVTAAGIDGLRRFGLAWTRSGRRGR